MSCCTLPGTNMKSHMVSFENGIIRRAQDGGQLVEALYVGVTGAP